MLSTLMEPQRGSTPASVRELQLLAKGTAGGRPSEASLLWFAFGSLAFVGGLTPTLSAGVPVRHKRGDITGVVLQRYPEEGTFSYVRLEGRQHGAEAADGPVGEGAWDWAASDDAGDAEGEIVTNAVAQDFNVGNVARIDFSTWSWNLAEAATQVEKLLQLIANINTRLLSAEKDYLSGGDMEHEVAVKKAAQAAGVVPETKQEYSMGGEEKKEESKEESKAESKE
ncbi:unnamed protein product, partial [Symbiodinium sp. KB8]